MKELFRIPLKQKDPLVVGDTVFQPSFGFQLSEDELEKACEELGETEEKKRIYLQEIRTRLSREGNFRTDDAFLLRFLRVRKFDCEKAYNNVKNYYDLRKKNTSMFENPSTVKSSKHLHSVACFPYNDEENRMVCYLKLGAWNPKVETFEEFLKPLIAFTDLITMHPRFQVNGIVGIWDMEGIGLRHFSEFMKNGHFVKFVTASYATIPWRIKKVLLPNTNRIVRLLYGAVSHLLSKKLAERVVLLGSDVKEIHEHINPVLLPKKLGGTLEDCDCVNPAFITDNIPYLEDDRAYSGES